MKSKFILITILFSLFLNIGHDFVIYEKIKNDSCLTAIEESQKNSIEDPCCNQIADLHHNFHFIALLPSYDVVQLENQTTPFYHRTHTSTLVYFTTFKPPRA
jgi:hypothetical protein